MRSGSGSRRQDRGTSCQPKQEAPTRQTPAAVQLQSVLENLFALSPDAIFITDSEGVIRDANPRSEELFGYTPLELRTKSIDCLVPERFRKNHPRFRRDFIANSTVRQMGASLSIFGLRKDGTEFPVDIMLKKIESSLGGVVVSFVRDMTAQYATREAAQRNDEQFRTVVSSVLDYAIYVLDLTGHVKSWNYGAERITGYTRKEALALHLSRLFTQEDQDRGQPAKLINLAAVQGRVENECWRVRKNGSRFWADSTLTSIRNSAGEIIEYVEVTRDITDRKRTADALVSQISDELQASSEALKESDARYRTVFHTNPEAVAISRVSDGIIVDVNQAFLDVTGYGRDEVIGKTTTQLRIWDAPRDRYTLVEVLRHDSSCRDMEFRFRRKNNELFWARLSASFVEVDGARCILSFARDVSESKVAEEKIKNLAFYDPLTGLANRRLLLERLMPIGVPRPRTNRKRALLFIDLDDFKTLNDTLGHHIGDLLLQEVARRIAGCVRKNDTVGRLGGDEFVIMLEDLSEIFEVAAAQAKSVAEKILAATALPYALENHDCTSAASIGITVFGEDAKSSNEVLQQADIAMYQAKAAGRNTIHFFAPSLQAAVNARASAEDDIRRAIRSGQFVLYYQPQMDSGRLIGAEALLRWNHPRRGVVFPGEFIPLAEDTGLILSLGTWALEDACKQIASWAHHKKTENLTVSVNISVRQMRHPSFVGQVLTTLERTGANPLKLKLELTESLFVENFEEIIAKMSVLRSHGFRFSVDDFGTGFSCLSYLKRLPIDELKIDRTFVHDIVADANSGAIAESIILLGRALGLSVIAEGVETAEQRDALVGLGCSAFQGWLFSQALPVKEFQSLCQAA
jgi:diguanylate cyclase (GGDEF)-like protein/PAS domain S-box-containing protein